MNEFILSLFSFVVRGMFPGVSSEKEETTETKKCMNCLRRVKIFHNRCPHCRTADFIYDTDLSGGKND